MFDKNQFKETFRLWAEEHLDATAEEACSFCKQQIPGNLIFQMWWLVEQSLQWFSWLQQRRLASVRFYDEDDEDGLPEERLVC